MQMDVVHCTGDLSSEALNNPCFERCLVESWDTGDGPLSLPLDTRQY